MRTDPSLTTVSHDIKTNVTCRWLQKGHVHNATPSYHPPPTTTTPAAVQCAVRDDVQTGMLACPHVLPHVSCRPRREETARKGCHGRRGGKDGAAIGPSPPSSVSPHAHRPARPPFCRPASLSHPPACPASSLRLPPFCPPSVIHVTCAAHPCPSAHVSIPPVRPHVLCGPAMPERVGSHDIEGVTWGVATATHDAPPDSQPSHTRPPLPAAVWEDVEHAAGTLAWLHVLLTAHTQSAAVAKIIYIS